MKDRELEVDDFRKPDQYRAYLEGSSLTQSQRADSEEKPESTTEESADRKEEVDERVKALVRQWDGPTEQVVAQLAQVSEFLTARPRGHVAVLRQFAGPGGSDSLDSYVVALLVPRISDSEKGVDDLAFDVRHHVEQNLDALLLNMGAAWRAKVRKESALATALIGLSALLFAEVGPFVKTSAILTSAIFGGFFAWFTRDIVALVEKWRS